MSLHRVLFRTFPVPSLLFSLLVLFLCSAADSSAQSSGFIETSLILSSDQATPFWLQSNRHGIYSPSGNQFLFRAGSHHHFEVTESLRIRAGADLIARPGSVSTLYFNQGYLAAEAFGFELLAGRFHNSSPIHDPVLSSGSLGISRNAIPVPQVRFGLTGWTPLPFTRGFVEAQGHIAHGWLGSRRYINDVLLHEKVLALRFGGERSFRPYAGIAHYATWGGTDPRGRELPVRWSDFFNVLLARAGDEQTPGPDQSYVLGDHLGALQAGFFWTAGDTEVVVYRQFPFELKANLMLKSYMDALTGLSVTLPDRVPFLDRILYEYIYTKYQAGPRERRDDREPDDRGDFRYNENYYNHYFYRSGWTYHMRSLGTPLFTLNEDNLGIFNNRVVGHHLGLISSAGSVTFTGKATFTRNFGKMCDNRVPDLGEGDLFGIECVNIVENVGGRSITQWALLLGGEAPIPFNNRLPIRISMEVAFDSGGLTGNRSGILFGVRWEP